MPTKAPPAAKPSKNIFDPFNSSATGHQRADNKLSGSTSWRDSRSLKLREQFLAGPGGGKRVSDTVGAGSLDFGQDGRTENGAWVPGAKGLRKDGQLSLWESMNVKKRRDDGDERPAKRMKKEEDESQKPTSVVNPFTPFTKQDGSIRESSWTSHEPVPAKFESSPSDFLEPINPRTPSPEPEEQPPAPKGPTPPPPPQIFMNCNFYINGSTYPLSDHALKHLIAKHGGNLSIALGRRTVTHVIIGRANAFGGRGGCGGRLAGSKIQKGILALKGKAKFVTAEWISESVKAGKRLPESRFEGMKMGPSGVPGIHTMFKPT